MAYLNKHRHRIVNYGYYQAEGISIGSGAIESTVKQIGQRIQLSGAQWNLWLQEQSDSKRHESGR